MLVEYDSDRSRSEHSKAPHANGAPVWSLNSVSLF